MPYKHIEERRAHRREWRKNNPGKDSEYYRAKILRRSSPEKQERLKKLWAKRDLPQRKLEYAIKVLKEINKNCWISGNIEMTGSLDTLKHHAYQALDKINEMENDCHEILIIEP